jgi:hypothetical protein
MREREVANNEGDERLVAGSEENRPRGQGNGDGITDAARLSPPRTQRRHVANPDDPPVRQPPQWPEDPRPGPNFLGLEGRIAIVQGQVLIVAVIMIAQLWLITDALFELLSGRSSNLGWLALVSGLGFVLALIVTFWPRRRITES